MFWLLSVRGHAIVITENGRSAIKIACHMLAKDSPSAYRRNLNVRGHVKANGVLRGAATPDNTVPSYPNCHRQMHVVDSEMDMTNCS